VPGGRKLVDRIARRREAAIAGHSGDRPAAQAFLADPDPTVVATALGALARIGVLSTGHIDAFVTAPAPELRRRVAELLPQLVTDDHERRTAFVLTLLGDGDDTVVDAAAWAAGEIWEAGTQEGERVDDTGSCPSAVLAVLMALVTDHADSLVRESAVAALGSIGSDAALPVILQACGDKASVRRRAVLALAPFEGAEVTAALERALADRDWQVRQAAEDLLA